MKPRDRQKMGEAGIPHRAQRLLVDGTPIAGEKRRRKRPRRRCGVRENPRGDPVAGLRQQREQAAAFTLRRGHRRRRAVNEADGADPLEPRLPREVPRPGLGRCRRRPERSARREPRSRHAHAVRDPAASADPHARGRLRRCQAPDAHTIQEVPLRAVAGTDPDNASGYVSRTDRFSKHRCADPVGAPVGGGDAGGEQCQRREPESRCGVSAQQQRREREEPGGGRRDPADRLHR